jgi:hypothetical protein
MPHLWDHLWDQLWDAAQEVPREAEICWTSGHRPAEQLRQTPLLYQAMRSLGRPFRAAFLRGLLEVSLFAPAPALSAPGRPIVGRASRIRCPG